ncbi:MAG: Rpn family recombination-promoting nuclease/putative transposase [Oscillospiraceae bacterium]|jgi:hypothetical protein|nr:Rpn family recombination-promoting nuclease/putative transposase [Oscillospiraceae bacterium]
MMDDNTGGFVIGQNINRGYRADVFSKVFNEESAALSAYNAVSGQHYPPETPIKIVTLSNVFIKGRVNDLAFFVGDKLVILIEHQSTLNPNMALRLLVYIALVYDSIYKDDNTIYGTKAVELREPEFYVLYNGKEPMKRPVEEKRLSELFIKSETPHEFNLDLKVKVYDINAAENTDMVAKSNELSGYVYLIQRVNYYVSMSEVETAPILKAIADTKKKGYLVEFLEKHESEVVNMLLYEFNVDRYAAVQRSEGRNEGRYGAAIDLIRSGITLPATIAIAGGITIDQATDLIRQYAQK